MKRLGLAMLIGLAAACGSGSGDTKDAATNGANDHPPGVETIALDWPARDLPADEPLSGVETGTVEVSPVDAPADAPPAPIDAPALDSPGLTDTRVAVDLTPIGERPQPTACADRVLSYDDRVVGASMSGVNSLSFSADGKRLAAGIEHSAVAWDVVGGIDGGVVSPWASGVDAGTCSGVITTCPAGIGPVAYLPDGRLAGLFCGGQFVIFGCVSPMFFGPFAVSPVGNLVASAQTPIHLWDTWTGEQVRTFASGDASTLAFSPDGAILVGGIKGVGVRVWDVATGAELANLPVTAAATDSVLVRVSPDGRWIGALYAGTLTIWNLRTYAAVSTFAVDPVALDFAFTRDGGSVITGGAHVNVHAVGDGSLFYQMGGLTYFVAVSPDGSLLAASGDRGVPVNLYCLY